MGHAQVRVASHRERVIDVYVVSNCPQTSAFSGSGVASHVRLLRCSTQATRYYSIVNGPGNPRNISCIGCSFGPSLTESCVRFLERLTGRRFSVVTRTPAIVRELRDSMGTPNVTSMLDSSSRLLRATSTLRDSSTLTNETFAMTSVAAARNAAGVVQSRIRRAPETCRTPGPRRVHTTFSSRTREKCRTARLASRSRLAARHLPWQLSAPVCCR